MRDLGCAYGQGYYFAQPLARPDVAGGAFEVATSGGRHRRIAERNVDRAASDGRSGHRAGRFGRAPPVGSAACPLAGSATAGQARSPTSPTRPRPPGGRRPGRARLTARIERLGGSADAPVAATRRAAARTERGVDRPCQPSALAGVRRIDRE